MKKGYRMFSFNYEKAKTLQHALRLLEKSERPSLLAGGTNLILKMKHGRLRPGLVISIGNLKELQFVIEKSGFLYIGAGTKIDEMLASGVLRCSAPLLLRVAEEIGSPEVRNMATVGGNIASVGANCGACGLPGCKSLSGGGVSPCVYASSADLVVPLLALDAMLNLVSPQGERGVTLEDFVTGDQKLDKGHREIIKEIYFKKPESMRWGYSRLATSKSMGITVISVAVIMDYEDDGTCASMSLAIGGSFRKPTKIVGIQPFVENQLITGEIIATVVLRSIEQLEYVKNLNMTLDYRREVTGSLITNAIRQAIRGGDEKGHKC